MIYMIETFIYRSFLHRWHKVHSSSIEISADITVTILYPPRIEYIYRPSISYDHHPKTIPNLLDFLFTIKAVI